MRSLRATQMTKRERKCAAENDCFDKNNSRFETCERLFVIKLISRLSQHDALYTYPFIFLVNFKLCTAFRSIFFNHVGGLLSC
mmetsp:Transcript_10781/g.30610  ORF Transcript_10781/g.30610 Transcript_10781/m.30610 type:complete len:83 (+) Transcript_10781:1833-2081(+)